MQAAAGVAAAGTDHEEAPMSTWKSIVVASTFLLACISAASAQTVVTGPIPATAPPGDPSRDYPFFASQIDLKSWGYVEEEYFIEGTANRYSTVGTGTGTVIDGGHRYKTRLVVRRP